MDANVTLTHLSSLGNFSVAHPMVMLYYSPTPPIIQIKSETASMIYGAIAPLWLFLSFGVWYYMNETRLLVDASIFNTYRSDVDVYQWWASLFSWGQLLPFYFLVLLSDSAETRMLYFYSVCVSAFMPFLGNWVVGFWYILEANQKGIRFYGNGGTQFISVKVIMVFIVAVLELIVCYEAIWYALDWWMRLE